jgi:hypothetical protein
MDRCKMQDRNAGQADEGREALGDGETCECRLGDGNKCGIQLGPQRLGSPSPRKQQRAASG